MMAAHIAGECRALALAVVLSRKTADLLLRQYHWLDYSAHSGVGWADVGVPESPLSGGIRVPRVTLTLGLVGLESRCLN